MSPGADSLTAMMMFRIQTALTAMTQKQTHGLQKALCHLNFLTMAQFRWCVSHTSLFPHECDYNTAENSALCTQTEKAMSINKKSFP